MSPISRFAPIGGLIQTRQDAARHYMGTQEHGNNWKPLLATVALSSHGPSRRHVPLANRQSTPFRDVPVLRLRVLIGDHVLRDAQEYGVISLDFADFKPRSKALR